MKIRITVCHLYHPERRVWVEVHTALFPGDDVLRRNEVFSPAHVTSQSDAATFHGRSICRLTDELQLAYLASSWIRDLSHGFHPGFLICLLDAVYLLKSSRGTLDWEGLLCWLDNEVARASLYVMLAYLARHGLDQSGEAILGPLATRQNVVGGLHVRLIHAMLDRYLVGGRPFTPLFHSSRVWNTLLAPGSPTGKLLLVPWNIAFPPHSPERYKVRYQLARIPRLLRRLGLLLVLLGAASEMLGQLDEPPLSLTVGERHSASSTTADRRPCRT